MTGAGAAAHQRWKNARRILCVRLDGMGDVLMTTPALRALKQGDPGRHLTLMASPAGAAIAALVPEVDELLVYDAPWMKATPPGTDAAADRRMIERLQALQLDAAVIFTVYSQTPLPAALTCYLAGIPLRLAHCRENPYQLLTERIPEPEPQHMRRHEVRRQLDLVASVGCVTANEHLSLTVPQVADEHVAALLERRGIGNGARWAVIHPGASAPSRRYPAVHYIEAARQLASGEGWQLVFTGTAEETALVEGIRREVEGETCSLAGRLGLPELAALIARAPVLIGNNSGPAHIAAAVGTPVVDLYALTNVQHAPWRVPGRVLFHDVPCRLCYSSTCPMGHHDCLSRVPPSAVVAAALELVGDGDDGRCRSEGERWVRLPSDLLAIADRALE